MTSAEQTQTERETLVFEIASYSAERIGMDQPIRKPFEWRGALWVCVGTSHRGAPAAECYRLAHPHNFAGTPTTYAEKTRDGDAARADPLGFYHGMRVRCAGQTLILHGPPARFIPGQRAQLSLFGD